MGANLDRSFSNAEVWLWCSRGARLGAALEAGGAAAGALRARGGRYEELLRGAAGAVGARAGADGAERNARALLAQLHQLLSALGNLLHLSSVSPLERPHSKNISPLGTFRLDVFCAYTFSILFDTHSLSFTAQLVTHCSRKL